MSKRDPRAADHNPYRELVLNAPDAILVISGRKLLFANPAAVALTGATDASSLRDRDVLEFTPPASHEKIVRLIKDLYKGQRTNSLVETEVLRADGSTREVELMACPTIYEGAKASIVFVRDITDRKRAERELRSSEERHRQVVESMNEALIVYGPDGNVKFVNQQFCKMFECQPSDVIGKSLNQVNSPETQLLVRQGIDRRRCGLRDRYEAPLKGRSGKTVFADISAAPLASDSEFAGSLALITDITDRKRAQEKLHESEQRYRELVDSTPNLIVSFDCQDRYLAVNKAGCRFLGLQEHEILGRTLEAVGVSSEDAELLRGQMAATRETGRALTREFVIATAKTGPRTLRRITSPMYDRDGTLTGVSVVSVDITDRKASHEKNQQLLRAIEEIDEVMFTTDASGVITYVNPAFERIYGFTREEAIGSTPRIIRSGQMPHEHYEWFWRELTSGRTVRTEFVNRRKDGDLVRMVASISPIHAEDGHLVGFTAVQRDITAERHAEEERRQFEQQLAHSTKMQALGTLAGGIAHDFNNILSIVMTHATIAEMSKDNPARIARAAGTIKSAVNRGAGLSRQILTFARKADVKFSDVDLNKVVREIGSMVHEMFPRNIQIELDLGPGIPQVRADGDQLHQALLNLCLNARDAMSNGGTLRLSTRVIDRDEIPKSFPKASNRDHVCVVVSDTGNGMSRETVSRIFEPFFTTKVVGKGSGLGLAVAYGIVKAHQGWINVSSELGLGSSFRLYFPASAAVEAARETTMAAQSLENGTGNLLVIEDEAEIAEALASQLAERGYHVVPATTAEEALARLGNDGIDLIVSDLGIPGTSSRDLVKLLRKAAPSTPLIPMTGYIDHELHRDVLATGTQPILEKPFTIEQLLLRIQEAAASRAS